MQPIVSPPLLSVVVLNYNGAQWISPCLESLKTQSIFDQLEVIVADNRSQDGSDKLAEHILAGWPNGRFIQHGENLGYCEGNNRAARFARGQYLFFLNNDTWLEPDCLEQLAGATQAAQAIAATPLVLEYDTDDCQWLGAAGFDLFGFSSPQKPYADTRDIFMPPGCSYLIDRSAFERLGGFDPVFFMYSDELDLSWRVWASGGKAIAVRPARLHHRGAVQVNPEGQNRMIELRTSDTKRFYANRNGLLVLLKNSQHLLLLLVLFQVVFLAGETLAGLLLLRRWSFVRRTFAGALISCWQLRQHVASERRRFRPLRRRSDLWMLRFLRWRLNRWDELGRVLRFGLPKVTPQ